MPTIAERVTAVCEAVRSVPQAGYQCAGWDDWIPLWWWQAGTCHHIQVHQLSGRIRYRVGLGRQHTVTLLAVEAMCAEARTWWLRQREARLARELHDVRACLSAR